MKIEKVISIEGNIVSLVFRGKNISVYHYDEDDSSMVVYFVSNQNEDVLFKQKISADCNQNVGFISDINYEGFHD